MNLDERPVVAFVLVEFPPDTSSRPTRMTFTPSDRVARIAPLTSAFGQWSPPIASTAIVNIGGTSRSGCVQAYSSATSMTSRPLYWPHFGQAR